MPARSIGTATISFGLVSIPVKLYSTVDTTAAIRFNYLSKDGSRLKQQYIRASDGTVVERDDPCGSGGAVPDRVRAGISRRGIGAIACQPRPASLTSNTGDVRSQFTGMSHANPSK